MELERANIMDKNHVFMWTFSPKQHGGVSPKPAGVVEKEVTQAIPPSHGGQKGKPRASPSEGYATGQSLRRVSHGSARRKGKPRVSPSEG